MESAVVRALFELATDAIVISEPNGAIVDANAPALQLFGYAHAELIGQPVETILPDRLRARRKDGSELDVEVSTREADGIVLAFVRGVSRHASAAPVEQGRERVLLVDDDALVLRALDAMLARSGYQVLATRSGDDALAIARSQPIDALVTDIMMPRTSGFAIAEALRALHPAAKVLYLSGYGEPPPERIGDGASFLAKPFSAAELLHELRTLLDRT